MSEEEFVAELTRRGRTPEVVRSISEIVCVDYLQEGFLREYGRALSEEDAEAILSVQRREFLEGIDVLNGGGAIYEKSSDSYMKRSDFPPET